MEVVAWQDTSRPKDLLRLLERLFNFEGMRDDTYTFVRSVNRTSRQTDEWLAIVVPCELTQGYFGNGDGFNLTTRQDFSGVTNLIFALVDYDDDEGEPGWGDCEEHQESQPQQTRIQQMAESGVGITFRRNPDREKDWGYELCLMDDMKAYNESEGWDVPDLKFVESCDIGLRILDCDDVEQKEYRRYPESVATSGIWKLKG